MTHTEAIRHLGALSIFANADELKAVEMAIEALHNIQPAISISVPILNPTPSFRPRITLNAIECRVCGDVIESKQPHEYKTCRCPGSLGCSVDGGLERLNRTGSNYIERSEWG